MATQDLENMTVAELDKMAARILCDDLREWGSVREDNDDINVVSLQVVQAMMREHGEAHLWQPNPWKTQPVHKEVQPDDELAGYGYSMVTPKYDAELERLIRVRLDAPYTGTVGDKPLVDAIFNRMEAIGGISLIWS